MLTRIYLCRSYNPSTCTGRKGKAGRIIAYTQATLVIVPAALVSQWISEIEKCAPELKVTEYLGLGMGLSNPEDVATFAQSVDIVVSTYQVLKGNKRRGAKNKHCYLRRIHWRRVVLDEMQEVDLWRGEGVGEGMGTGREIRNASGG